jgi:hypothetical protein
LFSNFQIYKGEVAMSTRRLFSVPGSLMVALTSIVLPLFSAHASPIVSPDGSSRLIPLNFVSDARVGLGVVDSGSQKGTVVIGLDNYYDEDPLDPQQYPAFVTISPSNVVTLTKLEWPDNVTLTSVSPNGRYIGGLTQSSVSLSLNKGLIWERTNPTTPLVVPTPVTDPFTSVAVFGVNNHGDAAVDLGGTQAGKFTNGVGTEFLERPTPQTFGGADAINNNGTVVGLIYPFGPSLPAVAAKWSPGFAQLEAVTGTDEIARGVSDDNWVIGQEFGGSTSILYWDPAGNRHTIPFGGSELGGLGLAITDTGLMGGTAYIPALSDTRAFLFHPSWVSAMLVDDIITSILGSAPSTPTHAVFGLSTLDGQAYVGLNTDLTLFSAPTAEIFRAAGAEVPEPTTVALFASGLVALFGTRRFRG